MLRGIANALLFLIRERKPHLFWVRFSFAGGGNSARLCADQCDNAVIDFLCDVRVVHGIQVNTGNAANQ